MGSGRAGLALHVISPIEIVVPSITLAPRKLANDDGNNTAGFGGLSVARKSRLLA
jgi:hypothetical protein